MARSAHDTLRKFAQKRAGDITHQTACAEWLAAATKISFSTAVRIIKGSSVRKSTAEQVSQALKRLGCAINPEFITHGERTPQS